MDSTNAIPSEVNKKVILNLIRAELGYLNLMKLFFLCVGFGVFFCINPLYIILEGSDIWEAYMSKVLHPILLLYFGNSYHS